MSHSKLRKLSAALASALVLVHPAAFAASISATFPVSLTIVRACSSLSVTPLDFGSISSLASNVDADGSLTFNCTSGTVVSISMNAGTGAGATFASRKLSSAGNTVNYSIFTGPERIDVFADNHGTIAVGPSGSVAIVFAGRVFANPATPPTGAYTDTITLTLSF